MLEGTTMPKRRLTHHDKPTKGPLPASAPRDAVLVEFARRLQAEMNKKGWSQSETAREATKFMPAGKTIQRDSISLYINCQNLPGPARLEAIAKAFGVDKATLLPSRGLTEHSTVHPPAELNYLEDGSAWLRINQRVQQATALKILALLTEDEQS